MQPKVHWEGIQLSCSQKNGTEVVLVYPVLTMGISAKNRSNVAIHGTDQGHLGKATRSKMEKETLGFSIYLE